MDKRLEEIRKHRKCKLLPVDASKQERTDAHKIKMAAKKIVREKIYENFRGSQYIPANLSVNHPDYGLDIADHLAEKAKRQQQEI